MQITFNYNNLDEAKALADIAEQKLQSLSKLLAHATTVTVEAEFEKVAPSNKGEVHRFEANLMADGQLYRADATEESFEAAIDEVRNELDKELRRKKGKQTDMGRRAGRALKRLIFRQN